MVWANSSRATRPVPPDEPDNGENWNRHADIRVIVTGNIGAGKTTLLCQLAQCKEAQVRTSIQKIGTTLELVMCVHDGKTLVLSCHDIGGSEKSLHLYRAHHHKQITVRCGFEWAR